MQSALFGLPGEPAPGPKIVNFTGQASDPSQLVGLAVAHFLKENAHLSAATLEFYGHALQKFIAYCSARGIHEIPSPLEQHIPAYTDYLNSKGIAGRSIQQYLNVLKIMMRSRGVQLKATYRIPSDERKESKLKAMERWFSESEVQACLDHRDGPVRDRLIIRLMVETGARVQEIASLDAEDIDLATRTAWIRTSKTMPRPVFFSKETADLFQYASSYANSAKIPGLEASSRLFPTAGRIKAIVDELLTELGMKKGDRDGRGPHTFRHYCATWLYYEGGMLLEDIATYLGDEPETIRKNYLHPTPNMLRKRVEKAWGWER